MGWDDLTGKEERGSVMGTKEYDVVCVGLAVGNVVVRPVSEKIFEVDTIQVDEIAMMCGGDALNQSAVLASLGHKVALISKVSDDSSGNMILQELEHKGVDTSYVAMDDRIGTSNCIVLVQENGQRSFCTFKGCLRNFGKCDIDFSVVEKARIVSIGGLFALPAFDQDASIELFKAAHASGTVTVADTKYDAFHIGLAGIKNLLEYTDYFFPSYDEAAYLSGMEKPEDIAAFFADKGARYVGIKLGGQGCYLLTDKFSGIIPAFPGKVVDTTGAGDNFMAGLIHGILKGWEIQDCALYANAAGTLAISRLGATSNEEYPEHIKEILLRTPQGVRLLREVVEI